MKKTASVHGFTLIELLITIVIVAIVATIGIPNFTQSIRSSRLTTSINEVVTALNFARSEAVKRNQPVSVVRSGTQWEGGWVVFTDANANGVQDAADNDTLLRSYSALANNYTLRTTPGFVNRVTYQASGISASGSFVLCDNGDGNNVPEPYSSRVAIINSVGRVRMGTDADNDGIPEKDDGELTSCITSPFTT